MSAIGRAGEHAAVWAAIGAGGALADPRRRRRWVAAGAVGPVAIGINYAVKVAVGRRRPLIEDHPRLGRAPSELSFPSAHATSSVAAAIALGRVEPRLRPALLVLAAAVCVGRPYLGMHYPSDVLAGVALGALIGTLAPAVGPLPDEERLIDLAVGAGERPGAAGSASPAVAAAGPPGPA
jgi:membrane-associated phospholipid phosphatase